MLQLRQALRHVARRPKSSALGIVTLGVALGATVGIATIVDHAVLRPLPYPEPDRLVVVWNTYPHWREREVLSRFWDRIDLAFPEYEALRARTETFAGVAIYRADERVLTDPDRADVVLVGSATHDLIHVLGTGLARGRWFNEAEDHIGAEPVAVLRHEFWQSRLGGDPAVLGSRIALDGAPHVVVGVLPPGFRFKRVDDTRPPEIWTALGRVADPADEGNHSFTTIARLRDGVSREQALAASVTTLRGGRSPEARGARLVGRQEYERDGARPMMLLFAGAVGLLLLLACATVATMQLTRLAQRGPEIAVRVALGASRARLAGQLFSESAILALLGGTLGVLLARTTVGVLARLMPAGTPGAADARIDIRVLALALGLSLATAVGFGLAPVVRAMRHDPARSLRGERAQAGGRGLLALVGIQSALAVLLLAGAGLLVRTVGALGAVDPGFATEQRLSFGVALPDARYSPERGEAWFEELRARIAALPGVTAVEATTVLPLSGQSSSNSVWLASAGPEQGRKPEAERRVVTAGYFQALRIPLLRGRGFGAGDHAAGPLVMVVSRAAAERLWAGRDPLGDRVELSNRWWTVVGVVDDVRDRVLGAPPATTVYLPASQWRPLARTLVLSAETSPLEFARPIQEIVRTMDPAVPVRDLLTLEQVTSLSTQPERSRATLLGGYALLAALLALTGIYGVTSYAASQQTREFAIRSALGAGAWSIVRLATRRTVLAALGGALAGLGLAIGLTRVLRRFLYGVAPSDPAALLVAVLGLALFALLAVAGPALRSARVSPAEALREG